MVLNIHPNSLTNANTIRNIKAIRATSFISVNIFFIAIFEFLEKPDNDRNEEQYPEYNGYPFLDFSFCIFLHLLKRFKIFPV